MARATLYKLHYPAQKAAGREDLRSHDLGHTGAVIAAQTGATLRTGATLAELMGRLGDSTQALPCATSTPRLIATPRSPGACRTCTAGWLAMSLIDVTALRRPRSHAEAATLSGAHLVVT